MPPDQDGGGQGLAMLRLEARRYKREMQQISMQRERHEQRNSTVSFSSPDSSDKWRFPDTLATSPSPSGTPMFWNREGVGVSHFEKLAIVEEATQTDTPSKCEVQTDTEKLQYDADVVPNMGESRIMHSTANRLPILKTCSTHCDELRSSISHEEACEYLAGAAVRVNADVVFTAKPKRVAEESQVETSECDSFRFFRPDEKETVSHTSAIATSPTGSLSNGQKSTDPVQHFRTGLRGLVFPAPQHDSACSPIHNLHDYGARFRSLRDIPEDTTPREMFSWQKDRSQPERWSSIPPPNFSTEVSTPQPKASCGTLTPPMAGNMASDFSAEINGSKQVRTELTGEGVMAARLATRIKHALEAINGKADTSSTNSTFNFPNRAIQSASACRLLFKDEHPEMKLFGDARETFGGRTLKNTEIAPSDSSLPKASQHARRVPASSCQNHPSSIPSSDADVYFQNVMASLSTDWCNSNPLSKSRTEGEMSPARAVRNAERRAEAASRANLKSCGDHHASHQPDGRKNSVKKDVCQSGNNHVREKQVLLSSVQKLECVAETAKRLYADLVDCANDELRVSTDCGSPVQHQDGDRAGDVSKFPKIINESCPSIENTSDSRSGVASTGNDEVCGRCHVCQPQVVCRGNLQECMENTAPSTCRDSCPCDVEQPPEEAHTNTLDKITIELADDLPTNITLSNNDCTNRPGCQVEISTPYQSPQRRECSPRRRECAPNIRGENTVKRGTAPSKDSCASTMCRIGNNQQMKKRHNMCILDPCCDGPRDFCHMPTRRCRSPTHAKYFRGSPRKSHQMPTVSKCLGANPQNSYQMPTDSMYLGADPRNSYQMPTDSMCLGANPQNSYQMPTDSMYLGADPRNSYQMPTDSMCLGANLQNSYQMPTDSMYLGADPRNSYQMPTDSMHLGADPRNSYQMPTDSMCLGASIWQPMEGTNVCHLDPYCVGDPDSCHMPTYAKSSGPASCGRGGGSRLKRNNGTKLYNKDTFVLSRCPVHFRRRVESTKGKLESNSCRGKIGIAGKVHKKTLHGEIPGHSHLLERNARSQGRPCRDRSKFTKGRVDENLKVRPLPKFRDHEELCTTRDDPTKHARECPRSGYVRNQSTLTATEIIKKEHASVGKKTRQSSGRYMTSNASALLKAYTEAIRHESPLDLVDRAAAAAGLAKDIEVMIADQLGKPYCKSNYLMPRRKLPKVQNESLGQSNEGVGRIAAVKKLKPVSLLSVVKRVEGNQRATSRKGLTSAARLMAEDGSGFSGQMHKELEDQALCKKQLDRKERARFRSQSLLFPRQEHNRHAMKGGSPSDLKNLANADSELEKTRKLLRVQTSDEFPSFSEELMDSYTLGSKRLRNTSPARDHSNKFLRLNVEKTELRASRMKQDQHSIASFNKTSSSCGRGKPLPETNQAKKSTKNKLFARRKIRHPVWVERMSKARDAFTSLLRPMLMAQSRMESQLKPTFCRRTLPPPGFMVTSPATPELFGGGFPGGTALQQRPSRIQRKKPITPIQYDINTGRKVVHSEREPGELLHTRVENQDVLPSSKPLDEKNIRISRRPTIKTSMIPIAVANSGRFHLRVKGWNADPLIRSDNPHKPTDIIRYNRNGGLDVQVRRRNADGKCKTRAGTSVRQKNLRHVTFAGMLVQNYHNQSKPKDLRAPHSSDSLHTTVANEKLLSSQPRRVKSALRKCINFPLVKIPPMRDQDKIHRCRGGHGRWAFHEGFWTDFAQKESQGDSPQSDLITLGCSSQFGSPISESKNAQAIDNEALNKPVEKVGAEDFLTTIDENEVGMTCEIIAPEGDGKSQSPAPFKSLGFLGSDGGGIIDLSGVEAVKGHLCPSQSNAEDKQAESCSELEMTITSKTQIHVSKIASHNQGQKQEPTYNEFPQPPLRLMDEVFPDSAENEAVVSMFNHPLESSESVQIEAQSDQQCLGSECITQQALLGTLADNQEVQLKEIELERTLMDIALHTILQDDPLQDKEIFATRVEPISLPNNERADKEVEAIVYSYDMSQSPPPKAVNCVDRFTEHDNLPLVDRATEFDVMPHADRKAELDNSSLLSKNQDSEETNIQRLTSPTQEKCTVKDTQVQHQVAACQAPWNAVGIQTPDTTISTTPLSSPAALPMLMPIFFQQWGTSILPTVLPNIHYELPVRMATSSDKCLSPASAINSSLSSGVNQGTQTTKFHIQQNFKESAVQVHEHRLSKMPINRGAAPKPLSVLDEGSDSEWKELKEGESSPPTPSTPLSSPNHKTNLKKAIELYPVKSSIPNTLFTRKDLQPSPVEACQTLVSEVIPPIQMVTRTIIEDDVNVDEAPQAIAVASNVVRRGTGWAKVKEMEDAALALLRAASIKTPPATSSTEYSCESSPCFHTWIPPGEVNIEDSVEWSTTTRGRFLDNLYNTRSTSFREQYLSTPSQSRAWSNSFGSGRASVGEIHNAGRSCGLLSEGEVPEPGVVSTIDEPGQIQIRYDFALHSRADLQGQGSEPGECHRVDAHASSS